MEETRKRLAEVWWFGAVLKFMQEDAIKQIGTAVVWAPILGRNRAILSMCKQTRFFSMVYFPVGSFRGCPAAGESLNGVCSSSSFSDLQSNWTFDLLLQVA